MEMVYVCVYFINFQYFINVHHKAQSQFVRGTGASSLVRGWVSSQQQVGLLCWGNNKNWRKKNKNKTKFFKALTLCVIIWERPFLDSKPTFCHWGLTSIGRKKYQIVIVHHLRIKEVHTDCLLCGPGPGPRTRPGGASPLQTDIEVILKSEDNSKRLCFHLMSYCH